MKPCTRKTTKIIPNHTGVEDDGVPLQLERISRPLMDSEDNHHANWTLIILLSYHSWARQSIILRVLVVGRVGLVVVGVYTASTLQFSALSINTHLQKD